MIDLSLSSQKWGPCGASEETFYGSATVTRFYFEISVEDLPYSIETQKALGQYADTKFIRLKLAPYKLFSFTLYKISLYLSVLYRDKSLFQLSL